MSNVWNEMSWRRYSNRRNERELDIWELEEIEDNAEIPSDTEFYGLYEDIYILNSLGVDELFYLNKDGVYKVEK